MKCPKCQFENPETAKFCVECGDKLEIICPNCDVSNVPSFKFCAECGHNLSLPPEPSPKELPFDQKIDKIRRYLPKGLTEKILAQRDRIEGERKQVTVMFCDMEAYSQISEKLGPEEAYGIMDQVYEILIHKVHDYEGTVNEMTGDGIMALFGAPIALEDATQRAIRSAMAIHREMARFSNKKKEEREDIPTLKMRVGIHTGPVVVGTLGNDLRVEFKAVGDTVNLASRMEGLAEPGTTFITEEAFKLSEGFFRFEALGEKIIKGKEEPVKVYRVIAPSTRRTRFDVSAERGLTPFVGRERELEQLLDAFERAKAGRGQAISIMSQPGGGKSRLLYEFRKAVANEDATFLEGKCLSYSRGVAYYPVIDLLKSNFEIDEADGDTEIKEKVKRGLKILGTDEALILACILELLSVQDSGIDKIPMSAEARKDRIVEALSRIVLNGSEIRPLIMAIEDLHWLDQSSEDVLKYALKNIARGRVLLIFTYRDDFVQKSASKFFRNQITLNRLFNRESLSMVSHLLGTEEIDRDLEDLILEKTEGNPFFIEEFIRSLKEMKIIEKRDNRYHLAKDIQDLTLPSTIQDVIMARVDSLPEGAKAVLQTGSVVEREFSYKLIKQVTGISKRQLLSHLSVLKNLELLFERGMFPETTYIFRHALTREVVYDSILTSRKRKLHEEIGDSIEQLYKDNLDECYGALAEHYVASNNFAKGAEYSMFASKKAKKSASFTDAIDYAEKGIDSLQRLPRTNEVDNMLVDARTFLGLTYNQINYHFEAYEAVAPIIDLAIKQDLKRRIAQIYIIVGVYYCMVGEDFPEATKYLEKSLIISEELKDIVSLASGNFWLGLTLTYNCEFEKAFDHLKRAIDINMAANNLWGSSSVKGVLSFFSYHFQGQINLGYKTSYEATRIAEEVGDIYSKAMAYTCHGISYYGKGNLIEATQYLLKGADFCERIKLFVWNAIAHQYLGETYFEIGDFEKSKYHYDKAIRLTERNRLHPSWINLNNLALARVDVMNDEKDINLEMLFDYNKDNKLKVCDGWMPKYLGEILLNIDDYHIADAEIWINKAMEADKNNGMMFHLAQDYALYADLLKRKGDKPKTKENLAKAIDILKECGADGWLKKYEEEMSSLSS
jgi:class 3 adenylate cyclase/tetratricopeptide (TPR) repeat protein